jgi:hypothetical protein
VKFRENRGAKQGPSLPWKDYNATMIELALRLMGMQRISLLLAHVMWHSDLSGLDDKKNLSKKCHSIFACIW